MPQFTQGNIATTNNPLDLATVLKFGLFLALVMVLSRIATHFAGPAGVYAIALLSGMADVDAELRRPFAGSAKIYVAGSRPDRR